MKKPLKPAVPTHTFFTRIEDGASVSIDKVVNFVLTGHKLVSKSHAEKLIINAMNTFVETFEMPALSDLQTLLSAVKVAAHEQLTKNNFKMCIPTADKLGDEFVEGFATDVTSETAPATSTNDKAPAEPVVTTADENQEATPTAESASEEGDGANQSPETATDPVAEQSETEDSTPLNTTEETTAPTTENENGEDENENGEDENAKKKIVWSRIFSKASMLIIGLIIGAIVTFFIYSNFVNNQNEGHAGGDGGNTPSSYAITLGTNTTIGENMVAYHGKEFMVLDSEKSRITIARDADKSVGSHANIKLTMELYTDENGQQYLCYTGSSANAYVEILAPIYPEGTFASSYSTTYEETVAKRNRLFGEVEISWNGDNATLTLLSTKQVYYLDIA